MNLVAFHTNERPRRGNGHFVSVHDGITYLFANDENKKEFDRNPDKYLPAYGGYCAFGVSLGKKVVGDPLVWRVVDGILCLSLDEDTQATWQQDIPGNIIEANHKWPHIKIKQARDVVITTAHLKPLNLFWRSLIIPYDQRGRLFPLDHRYWRHLRARTVSFLFGFVFVAVGVLGFIPNPLVASDGIFAVNGEHNWVHILTGGVFLLGAIKFPGTESRILKTVGVTHVAVALLDLVPPETCYWVSSVSMNRIVGCISDWPSQS